MRTSLEVWKRRISLYLTLSRSFGEGSELGEVAEGEVGGGGARRSWCGAVHAESFGQEGGRQSEWTAPGSDGRDPCLYEAYECKS